MSPRHSGFRSKGEPIRIIIFEHDVDDPLRSSGAIIMEQYAADSPEQSMDRAQGFADSGKHGRVWVGDIKVEDMLLVRGCRDMLDPVVELMRVAKCPDEACGGQGFTVIDGGNGEGEQQQCQWCCERDALVEEADSKLPF